MPQPPPLEVDAPRRNIRRELKTDEEHTFTQDQIMAVRGYEPKPGGGWKVRDPEITT